jgi:Zn-dependent protease
MAALGAAVWRLLDATGALRPPIDEVIFLFVYINVILAVFNMIPVPPLDGSALLFRIVSPSTAWQIRPVLAQYGGLLLLALIVLMWSTPLGDAVGDVIYGITKLLLGL